MFGRTRRADSRNEENLSSLSTGSVDERSNSTRKQRMKSLLSDQNPNVPPPSSYSEMKASRDSPGKDIYNGRSLPFTSKFRGLNVCDPISKRLNLANAADTQQLQKQGPATEELEEAELELEVIELPPPPSIEDQTETKEVETSHKMIHAGHKLFWRINRTIDFHVFVSGSESAVVVRSFDSVQNTEFAPIVMNLDVVLEQVEESDTAMAAHQTTLSEMSVHKKKWAPWQEGDATLKDRRRQKDNNRRKSLGDMTPEQLSGVRQRQASGQEAQRWEVQRKVEGKIATFVINRFEVEKDKATGEILTKIVPRSSDTFSSKQLVKPPNISTIEEGARDIGPDMAWNKKENTKSLRRASIELDSATEETIVAVKKASDKQKSVQAALNVVKALSDRKHFDALPTHKQKFHLVVRKALFQQRLEGVQDALDMSVAYAEFEATMGKDSL